MTQHEPTNAAAAARPRSRRTNFTRGVGTGVVVSLVIHAVALLVALLVPIRFAGVPGRAEGEGTVDFAVLTEAELGEMLDTGLDERAPELPALAEAEAAAELLEATDTLADTAALDVTLDAGAADLGAGIEIGELGGSGGGGGASFFGLEAQGSRFAYIVDVSSSMRQSGRWPRTAAELGRSITALPETGGFLVVLYSSQASVLGEEADWTDAGAAEKRDIIQRIGAVYPEGGTEPLPAFSIVYGLRVKPDAIYFMTDGRFDPAIPDEVHRLNRSFRIPIHCILFTNESQSRSAESDVRELMTRIARQSGGRFNAVEIGG